MVSCTSWSRLWMLRVCPMVVALAIRRRRARSCACQVPIRACRSMYLAVTSSPDTDWDSTVPSPSSAERVWVNRLAGTRISRVPYLAGDPPVEEDWTKPPWSPAMAEAWPKARMNVPRFTTMLVDAVLTIRGPTRGTPPEGPALEERGGRGG